MFHEVTDLLFPDEVFALRSKANPQDIQKEERKKLDFSETVAKECEAFIQARSLSQISLEFDIQQASKHRSVLAATLEQLGKLMDACGGPLRATIDTFDNQLAALQK